MNMETFMIGLPQPFPLHYLRNGELLPGNFAFWLKSRDRETPDPEGDQALVFSVSGISIEDLDPALICRVEYWPNEDCLFTELVEGAWTAPEWE